MSDQPGPTHRPYGESEPYGQQPAYQPYGQNPYGQDPYGQQPGHRLAPAGDRRPGTVTAAAWITIVLSALTAALFGITGLALMVARDEVIAEMERVPEFNEANIDPDAVVGVLAAVMIGLVLWCLIAIVLAVFVLRRSNVSRILLVISASVAALLSLLSVTSGVTLVPLIASVAAIVLLFSGGAGDWFKGVAAGGYPGGYAGYPGGYPATSYPDPYGQQPGTYGQPGPYGQQPHEEQQPGAAPEYPNPYGNPYGAGEQGGQPGQADSPNPYGQYPQGDEGGEGENGGDRPNR
jgi:hypothetical protein